MEHGFHGFCPLFCFCFHFKSEKNTGGAGGVGEPLEGVGGKMRQEYNWNIIYEILKNENILKLKTSLQFLSKGNIF